MTYVAGLVIGGVDTHADSHTAAVIDQAGRMLGHAQFPASTEGYRSLLAWLRRHGEPGQVGVEGTGSYGAGLARYLTAAGVTVIEVDRPDRRGRRRRGKSDPLDAEAAARAVLAGTAAGIPKTRTGPVEAIRALQVTRRGAVKARTAAVNALHQLIITAPDPVRAELAGLTRQTLIRAAASLQVTADLADPAAATRHVLRRLAVRCQHLTAEITDADRELRHLVTATAPGLIAQYAVGPHTAAQLLVTAGDNPWRLRSDASFAALCGAAPVPASSGRTTRHRLSRGGDRAANSALYTIVMVRMQSHEPTRKYVARRRAEGLTTPEIMRCLKRYAARELLPHIHAALHPPATHTTHPAAA
jgi:transposase